MNRSVCLAAGPYSWNQNHWTPLLQDWQPLYGATARVYNSIQLFFTATGQEKVFFSKNKQQSVCCTCNKQPPRSQ
jgi:hypothetical protein